MIYLDSNLCFSIVSLLLFLHLVFCIRIKSSNNNEFFDKTETNTLKGIAALLVLIHHFSQRLITGGDPLHLLYQFSRFGGFTAVGLFFLIARYIIQKQNRDKKAINFKYILRRVLNIYICLTTLSIIQCFYEPLPIKSLILNILTLSSYGEPIWFLRIYLLLNINYYLILKFNKREITSIYLLIVSILVYIVLCYMYNLPSYWYNTSLCFSLGVLLHSIQNNKRIMQLAVNKLTLAISLLALFLSLYLITRGQSIYILQIIAALFFSLFIFIFTYNCKIQSKFLHFVGIFSLELFLVHSFIFNCITTNTSSRNQHLILLIIALCILAAYIVNKLTTIIYKIICKRI